MSPTDRQDLIEEAKAFPDEQRKQNRWNLVYAIAILLLVAGVLGYIFVNETSDSDETKRLSVLEQAYDAQRTQFIECKGSKASDPACQTPVAPPADEIKPDTDGEGKTTTIIQAIRPGQIDAALVRYCSATGRCDAEQPTAAQVRAAVAAFCRANGDCTPPTPKDGEDSTVAGPQGPGPSDAQVANAVSSYCSTRNECTPPAPKDGKDGKDFTCPEGFSVRETVVVTQTLPEETTTIYGCRAGTGG